MDDRTAQLLQLVMRRGSRSLLHYVSEAVPWTGAEDRDTLARVQELIEEDRAAIAALGRLLRRHRVPPPYLGPYPEPFTTLNYLSLDRLLPLLVEHQRQSVAELEVVAASVADPEARLAMQHLLEVRRRHLTVLEELHKKHTPVGSRV
jgi:hypothetical protein